MNIQKISKQINDNAKSKGFWENNYNLSEKLMLIVSEIAEAQEADREDHFADLDNERISLLVDSPTDADFQEMFEETVKNTFEDEMADAVIRILDLCYQRGVDLESHIRLKMKYNSLRPHKHSKKY